MDDRPLTGGGGYQINWDELDEMSNPFDTGAKSMPKSNPISRPTAMGDNEINSSEDPWSPPQISPPSSKSRLQNDCETSSTVNPCQGILNGGDNFEVSEFRGESIQAPQSYICPAELSKALEEASVAQNNNSYLDINTKSISMSDSANGYSSPSQMQTTDGSGISSKLDQPMTQRIDSSTRPASPAQSNILQQSRPTAPVNNSQIMLNGEASGNTNQQNAKSKSALNAASLSELEALRLERVKLTTTIEEMKHCIAEYDRSLQHLVEEKNQSQAHVNLSVADLMAERDQAIEELTTIEKAFGDLHRRFEKSKQVVEGFKKNEDALKRSIEEYKSLLERQERKILAMKKYTEEKLLKVNEDTELQRQEFERNQTRLETSLRIAELQVKSLQSKLEQKTKENEELTKICDELLSKYGALT